MERMLHNARFALRRALVRIPTVYFKLDQVRASRRPPYTSTVEPVRSDTEILITGLPRTANSFAVRAFEMAQGRSVKIAHHAYPSPQIVGAASLGIPALLLVRDPEEVALSRVASHPPITLRQALVDFVQCYENVLPWRDHFVVGDFKVVTSDFGSLIAQVNTKFDTGFIEFDHTEENVKRCFEEIDGRYQAMNEATQKRFGEVVARPSAEREQAKRVLSEALNSDNLAPLRHKANSVYRSLVGETSQ
jgi:hypothetical protein